MQYRYVFGIIGLMAGIVSPVFALPARAAEPPRVVITEINWSGSGQSSADEWLELGNLGGVSVDLSGWAIGGAATGGEALALADGTTLNAGGVLLVANYAMGESSTLSIQPNLVTTALSLPNTKIALRILMPDGTLVDSLDDPGTPDFGSSTPVFASMERNLTTLAWQSATSSFNLLDITQLGTPGLAFATLPIISVEQETSTEIPVNDVTPEDIAAVEIDATPEDNVTIPGVELFALEPDVNAIESEPVEASSEPVEQDVIEPLADESPPPEEVLIEAEEVTEIIPDFTLDDIQVVSEPVVESPTVPDSEPNVVAEATPSTEGGVVVSEPNETASVVNTAPENEPENILVVESASTTLHPTTSTAIDTETIPTTGDVVLNEIYSAPKDGNEEWIEILNRGDYVVDVNGWFIRDASGKQTSLNGELSGNTYLVIRNPLGKLNNSGDTVELVNSNGVTIDTIAYGTATVAAPKYNESLNRQGDSWHIGNATTIGQANVAIEAAENVDTTNVATDTPSSSLSHTEYAVPQTPVVVAPAADSTDVDDTIATKPHDVTYTLVATATPPAAAKTKSASTKQTKKVAVPLSVTSLAGIADNISVSYEGTVIALPGTFGTQLTVLTNAMLYMNSADWPTLALGDKVRVTGITSTARGEQRIKLKDASAIVVTGHQDIIVDDNVDVDRAPHLVRLQGSVVTRQGNRLVLLIDGKEVTVDAHEKSDIVWSTLKSSTVRITGIIRRTADGYVLMPRNSTDIEELQLANLSTAVAGTNAHSSFPSTPIIGGGLFTGALTALGYWFAKSRTLIPSI